jgi:hypothetical protein
MVGTANNGRSRQAFSVVNGGQDLCPNSAPASNAGSECGGIEFTREDVEALLNEKPKRKDRFNLKVSGFSNILRLLSSKNVSFFLFFLNIFFYSIIWFN